MLLVVGCAVDALVQLASACHFQFDEPAFVVGVGVEQAGVFHDGFVDCRDFAIDEAVDVAGGFDGLDFAHDVASLELESRLLHFDVGDVGQLVHGELGQAQRDVVALNFVPFVGFGVDAVGGGVGHGGSRNGVNDRLTSVEVRCRLIVEKRSGAMDVHLHNAKLMR